MSPEQAEGKPADARSDIFSFGTVLHEMLAGRRAFGGGSAAAIIGAIIYKEPEPLNAPPAVQAIVSKCLAKSPEWALSVGNRSAPGARRRVHSGHSSAANGA